MTEAEKQRPTNPEQAQATWVFGYGSLIYKVDFPYLAKALASISGWQRRFWQGSHDHRGTPQSPGRVVTLLPANGATCKGIAYLVEPHVFEHLDYREKNGYQRMPIDIQLSEQDAVVSGLVYVGDENNPAFMGPASNEALADIIAVSHGPSGSNRDYVLQLADALRELGDNDTHVFQLECLLDAKLE